MAFAERSRPAQIVRSNAPATDEYNDAVFFEAKTWSEVSIVDLEDHPAAIFGFTPPAFCYFLPAIYSVSVKEARPDLVVATSLVSMLDRSNVASSWDGFFRERWPLLSENECQVTQEWLLWLTSFDPLPIADASLTRAYDTLVLLRNLRKAAPIADRARVKGKNRSR